MQQYTLLLNWREGLTVEQRDGALMRRAQWQYPEGSVPIGEYWLASQRPGVIVVLEADGYAPIMEMQFTWGDVFDITVHPSITPEDGLKIGPEIMARAMAHR